MSTTLTIIETAPEPNGPWSFATEVTASVWTASFSGTMSGDRYFYRARLK